MGVEFKEWDPAEDIRSEEDAAAFLNAVLELDDPDLVPEALGVIARSQGMSALAQFAGVGRESLYKSLSKDGNPCFSTVAKIIDGMGLRLQVVPKTPVLATA